MCNSFGLCVPKNMNNIQGSNLATGSRQMPDKNNCLPVILILEGRKLTVNQFHVNHPNYN